MRWLGFAAWALLLAAPLRAQPLRVAIELPECSHPSWSDAELLATLGAELRNEGVAEVVRGSGSQSALAWLTVEEACDPTRASVLLRARGTTGAEATRSMSLTDVPAELQARTIALGLAELWRSSWFGATEAADAEQLEPPPPTAEEPPSEPEPATEPGPAPAAEPARVQPPTAATTRDFTLSIGPALRLYAPQTTFVYGGRASLRGFRFELGLSAFVASRNDSLGTLHYGLAHAFAAYDLVRAQTGDYAFAAGPRVALGFSWGDAEPTTTADGFSAFDLVWDAAAQLTLARAFGERWSLALILIGGYAHGPRFAADQRTRASLDGAFGEASLALQRHL